LGQRSGKEFHQVLPNHESKKDQQTPANHGKIGGLRILALAGTVRHEANEKKRRRAHYREAVRSLMDG
jgi:hypothetical protein